MDAVAYALANNVLAGVIGPEGQTAKTALPATRYIHSQSTLSDGKVLVVGGVVSAAVSADVQSYDAGTFIPTPGRAALLGYLAAT